MDASLLIVALSTLTVTSYQPTPAQTKPECKDRYHCTTSIDDGITMYGVAVSQDLLRSGQVRYGDVLDIPGLGLRIVNDAMGPTRCVRHNSAGHCIKRVAQVKAIDLMVFSYEEEHNIGVRHLPVTRLRQSKGAETCNTKRIPHKKTLRTEEHVSQVVMNLSDTTVHSEPK